MPCCPAEIGTNRLFVLAGKMPDRLSHSLFAVLMPQGLMIGGGEVMTADPVMIVLNWPLMGGAWPPPVVSYWPVGVTRQIHRAYAVANVSSHCWVMLIRELGGSGGRGCSLALRRGTEQLPRYKCHALPGFVSIAMQRPDNDLSRLSRWCPV